MDRRVPPPACQSIPVCACTPHHCQALAPEPVHLRWAPKQDPIKSQPHFLPFCGSFSRDGYKFNFLSVFFYGEREGGPAPVPKPPLPPPPGRGRDPQPLRSAAGEQRAPEHEVTPPAAPGPRPVGVRAAQGLSGCVCMTEYAAPLGNDWVSR